MLPHIHEEHSAHPEGLPARTGRIFVSSLGLALLVSIGGPAWAQVEA